MTTDTPVTLVMQLYGPMQSWGFSSRWSDRDSGPEPSKSGVVGILAAALGRGRDEPVDDLAELRMAVRVDREGVPAVEFQTAGGGASSAGIAKAGDKAETVRDAWNRLGSGKNKVRTGSSISNRHHIQDAAFLVALEGNNPQFIENLDNALRSPVYPIGLGRRSYVPSVPLAMPRRKGVFYASADEVLSTHPWLHFSLDIDKGWQRVVELRTITEVPAHKAHATRMDQPIGAAFATRQFGPRGVKFCQVPIPIDQPKELDDDRN